ncbi:MAG: SRPBCC family protein [Steroidobacteraceae bacterium]
MIVLKRILVWLAAILVLIALAGLLLPRQVHIERKLASHATPQAVYAIVNSFARYNEYSPWARIDPATRYTFSGPVAGPGARMRWESKHPSMGVGSQVITSSDPPRSVSLDMDFGQKGSARSNWHIEPTSDGCVIIWTFDMDLGMNPIARYMGLTFDRLLGADFEAGLTRLGSIAEADTEAQKTTLVDLPERSVVATSRTSRLADVPNDIAAAFAMLRTELARNGWQAVGHPLAISRRLTPEEWQYEAALEIDAAIAAGARSRFRRSPGVKVLTLPATLAVRATHNGSYEQMQPAYDSADRFIAENGLVVDGDVIEEYLADPASTAVSQLRSHVYVPVTRGREE